MGKFQRPQQRDDFTPSRPPEVHAVLSDVFKRKGIPDFMPQNIGEAASWWINHQEPADQYAEAPMRITNREGEVTGWTTPYHDRLRNNLWIFLGLQRAQQLFIRDAWEDSQVAWRGDDTSAFAGICKEAIVYRNNKSEYIEDALQKMKSLRFAI